jgi:hypothetical protein
MTALSGVGVALSVGVVCAPLSELNIAADASTSSAVNSVFALPIVIFLSRTLQHDPEKHALRPRPDGWIAVFRKIMLNQKAFVELPTVIFGARETPVNGEIIASGIRRGCIVRHQRVATTVTAFGKQAPTRYPTAGQAFALTRCFGFPVMP